MKAKFVCLYEPDERKMPRAIKMSERRSAWPKSRDQDSPRARRFAYEKGIATPTMNMNDGWIMSQKEQPRQETCSNWRARASHAGLAGKFVETLASEKSPEATATITNPR